MRDYGWDCVCRLQKHRRCHGQERRHPRRPPYWTERGGLSGGLKGLVVGDGATYSATNRLTVPAGEGRRR